jgi:hypothetical protein
MLVQGSFYLSIACHMQAKYRNSMIGAISLEVHDAGGKKIDAS